MYPISFDNPNRPKPPSNGQPIAANRNDASTTDSRASLDGVFTEEGAPDRQPDSLLVVECRRDDKWRVELCTDLSELDGALDVARALRGSPDVDEVCLTLEVSGINGRESRREVLRFAPEAACGNPQIMTPSIANAESAVTNETVGSDPMAVLHATLKSPDFCFDDLDFSDFAIPAHTAAPADSGSEAAPCTSGVSTADTSEPVRVDDEAPLGLGPSSTSDQLGRMDARDLLASIYSDKSDPFGESDAIRVELPHNPHHTAHGLEHSDWLDRTDRRSGLRSAHRPSSGGDDDVGDDLDDAIVRLENPLLGRQNGLATKLLVFTGAIALIVLGGALAELLAVVRVDLEEMVDLVGG